MIEQWFKQDIEALLTHGKRTVVCDANGSGAFLMNALQPDIIIMMVHNELEELEARYLAEKDHRDERVVFYTSMPRSAIKYLLEYAGTGGLIDLTDLVGYIKTKLFAVCGVNTTLDGNNLVMAARLSRGKDVNWWKGVATGIIQPFNLKDYMVPFICNPNTALSEMDETVVEVFTDDLYQFIGKQRTTQTADMMAREVMNAIFDGLLHNNISTELLELYYTLTDMTSAHEALHQYVEQYELPADVDPLQAHPDHPFLVLDRKVTEMLSKAMLNGTDTSAIMHAIGQRIASKYAVSFKASWLSALADLMGYQPDELFKVQSLNDFTVYYQQVFCPIDSAMRQLYVAWLNNPHTLRPLQYYYEQQAKILQDKWYSLASDYQSTQNGWVVNALQQAGKVAVIVGDGLRLEVAETVAKVFNKEVKRDVIFSELPSVTECGMSALYGCEGVEMNAQARFAHLKTIVPSVEVMQLDSLNDSVTAEKLILTFGDIDQVGEKKQLAGLKDISAYPNILIDKIKSLLAMGYSKVYLTTDHGFVITGILDEADKIPVPAGTDIKVDERFLLSNDRIVDASLIEKDGRSFGYAYLYFARTDKPFVSRGTYGYAHGGFTPQECIIPGYCFAREVATGSAKVSITNKNELQSVTGNYFTVKLKADGDTSDLFSAARKIKLQLFSNQGKLLSSMIENVQAGIVLSKELEIQGNVCKLVVIDFDTTEQLDYCIIEASKARDIDDLF